MALIIKTNRQWRPFVDRGDVPPKVLASRFDWTNKAHAEFGDYSDGFFQYHGIWYHLAMFERGAPEGWGGIHRDSFSSGVLVRLSSDGDSYQVATYYSGSE